MAENKENETQGSESVEGFSVEDLGGGSKIQKGEALWLMSFSDMALVLLCFFVLMISVMKPDKQKYESVKEGIKQTEELDKESLQALAEKLKKVIKKRKLDHAAGVEYDSDGLRIEFKDGVLFASGSSKSNPEYRKMVRGVLKIISRVGKRYRMIIEGHTDDVPIRGNPLFPSNWELSASRGFSLMRSFHRLGIEDRRISVVAYAHTRPKVSIQGLKGKDLRKARSANRRVVVWVEAS
ncbi:MAG: flagellar motor protein MotB [Oligoflexales bacterium]